MTILERAELLLQAKNYSGTGAWLDESDNSHNAQLGSTAGDDTNDPLFLEPGTGGTPGVQYLYMPGTVNNTVSTSTFTLTGNITATAVIKPDDWTPGTEHSIFAKTSGNNGFQFVIQTTGELAVKIGDGAAITTYVSTAATGETDGTEHTVTAIYVDGGSGTVDFQVDGGALGTQVATTKTLTNAATNAVIGASVVGGIVSVTLTDGASTTYLNPDFTDRIRLYEPYATVVDAAGNTWTINRSATGVPATVIDQPMFVFDGIDNYMEIADHANLNFDTTDSLTLVWAGRDNRSSGEASYYLAAKQSDNDGSAGWGLFAVKVNGDVYGILADGTANLNDLNAAASTAQVAKVHVLRRDATANEIEVFTDGAGSGTPTTDTTAATSANGLPLRIGVRSGGVNKLFGGETHAVSLFREALTDAQIAEVGVELTDPPATRRTSIIFVAAD